MASTHPTRPAALRPLPRRAVLRSIGLSGLVLAAGCSISDPRIEGSGSGGPPTSPHGSGSATPTATPHPTPALPGAESAARAEADVAALATALLAAKAELSTGQRRLVAAARDAHRLHAAVLRSPEPTARSTAGATPGPAPAKPAKISLRALVAAERALAGRHAKLVPPARGLTTLLFGSLSVAATTYAAALGAQGNVPIARTPANPPTPEVLDDVAGIQAVVTQVHALIYGYQVAIGRLSTGSKARRRAVAGLDERRALRDRLISALLARKASVPAAEPAYVPSVRVRNAATAGQLIARMETAFVPFAGQWLAAAALPADQDLAWATMRRAAALARTWGGPVTVWPGWPT